MNNELANPLKDRKLSAELRKSLMMPCIMILFVYAMNLFYNNYLIVLFEQFDTPTFNLVEHVSYVLCVGLLCYWLFCKVLNPLLHYLEMSSFSNLHHTFKILLPFIGSLCKIIFGLSLVNFMTPFLGLPKELSYFFSKATSILIICVISYLIMKLITVAEQLLMNRYSHNPSGDLMARKVFTQTLILKRVSTGIVLILTAGAILMLFDNVRALGASVLTTAGIFGLVLTFAAQRSLGNIFSGLEIALAQPIKIGDSVVIENEFGVVEEINFRSVVIKLWDWRRLVVPTSYFLEKPFQNWSREQNNNLIGTVNLYADFTLSVENLRIQLQHILEKSPLWDKKVANIQVSDMQEKVMELRILASARSPADAWDLRCEVREKLIAYIAQNHPNALPLTRSRTESAKSD